MPASTDGAGGKRPAKGTAKSRAKGTAAKACGQARRQGRGEAADRGEASQRGLPGHGGCQEAAQVLRWRAGRGRCPCQRRAREAAEHAADPVDPVQAGPRARACARRADTRSRRPLRPVARPRASTSRTGPTPSPRRSRARRRWPSRAVARPTAQGPGAGSRSRRRTPPGGCGPAGPRPAHRRAGPGRRRGSRAAVEPRHPGSRGSRSSCAPAWPPFGSLPRLPASRPRTSSARWPRRCPSCAAA